MKRREEFANPPRNCTVEIAVMIIIQELENMGSLFAKELPGRRN